MNVSVGGPITVFPNDVGHDRRQDDHAYSHDERTDYLRRRERMERAAAKSSESTLVRRIHQELAQAYANAIQKEG